MSWRVVIVGSRAKLELKLGYLVVRTNETRRVHLDEISVLIIENTGSTVSSALLEALWKRKIAVLFCDAEYNPGAMLTPCYGGYDSSANVLSQISWNQEIKDDVWAEIIKEKIRKQAECLDHYNLEGGEKLYSYVDGVKPGDVTNREGQAAKVYFNSLMGHAFSRSDENVINACLNYGYAIILSAVNREIVANGYITQLGINHRNPFNRFNLGSDLMEPFRPLVDMKALSLPLEERFTSEQKHILVDLLNDTIVVRGKRTTVLNGISLYVRSVFNALNFKDVSELMFYQYEF